MPITAYYLAPDGQLVRSLSEDKMKSALESRAGLLWVDVAGTTEEDGRLLKDAFHFHHLAIEDCISSRIHPPKIDDFGDYIFLVIHGVNYAVESEIVETAELAIFLGRHFVVSNHNLPLYAVDAVRQGVEDDGRPMRRGADFLAHALADALIDNVLPTVDRITEVAGEIEEETIRRPRQEILEAILKLKHSTLRIHRVMAPQREVFNRLSRGQFPIITDEARIFYRDIYDHVARIEDLNQTVADRADNALSTYLSSVANRQNETMKLLTVIATIVLPLTLLAGIYGMNFENMPELKWEWGYFAVLGVMATTIVAAAAWFWARGWIASGRRKARRTLRLAVHPEKLIGYVRANRKR